MASYELSHIPSLKHLQDLAKRQKGKTDALATRIGALEQTGAQANKVAVVNLSIPASGWSTDSTAACPCYKDVAVSGLTAADVVAVVVDPASTAVAAAAGLATTESRAGVLRLRAQRAPTATISASYYIIR